MDTLKQYTYMIEKNVDKVLANPYIMATLKVTLVLYAAQLAPKLPTEAKTWFDNTFVKILGIMLLIYLSNKDFQLAILIAVILVLGANLAGCSSVTLADIQAAFNNDNHKMQQGVEFAYYDLLGKLKDKTSQQRLEIIARAVGLPYNIVISDETAPYVATLLMYYGFKFTENCQPPN